MSERRKFTLYMHPEEQADSLAMDVIESVSQRTRGDFLRNAVIAGCALQQVDKRLPLLIATLFDGNMTAGQLVAMIRQTTGWKPDEAEIKEVVAALISGTPGHATPLVSAEPGEGAGDMALARKNLNKLLG
ncbi:plasmid partitioning/stability family protein [Erwinia sp. MYb416]|uniref:plasmid partitioning/stability family protein n=1 Tax=Erwinia sp. MYb416 TaxID=3108532 RepID=UPI00309991D9